MVWLWTLLIAVLVLCLPIVVIYARRRLLTGAGGHFDCALDVGGSSSGPQWALGFARYHRGQLEWFRALSLSPRPALSINRCSTDYLHQRQPSFLEASQLFDHSCVVTIRNRFNEHEYELAMEPHNVMGLMTWLESAPPGSHVLPGSQDSPL